MVYIDRNGFVLEKRNWDMNRLIEIFMGLGFLMVQFFLTLINPFKSEKRGGNGNNRDGNSWGSGGGGGGGGSGGGGGGGGNRPNRRIGRIQNTMDSNIPCSGGGCSR